MARLSSWPKAPGKWAMRLTNIKRSLLRVRASGMRSKPRLAAEKSKVLLPGHKQAAGRAPAGQLSAGAILGWLSCR